MGAEKEWKAELMEEWPDKDEVLLLSDIRPLLAHYTGSLWVLLSLFPSVNTVYTPKSI